MLVLLRVSNAEANKGIYHTRKNGDFVQELFRKNADCVYEVTERNNYFGQKYAFFLIECQENDRLKYGNQSKIVTDYPEEYEIYYNAVHLDEMCKGLLNQEKTLPSKVESFLSDYLNQFFSQVIQWESKGYDSATTWYHIAWILEHLGKMANDFVEQSKIDYFFQEMCRIHEVWQLEIMLPSELLTISPEVEKSIEKCKKEVQETIEIAKNLISQKSSKDIQYTVGDIPFVSAFAKNTPCGKIGVHIIWEYEFSVMLIMYNNDELHEVTQLIITDECKEFESRFAYI